MSGWDVADQVSDEIVEVLNRATDRMQEQDRLDPLQLIVGMLLAFFALEKTIPEGTLRPTSLQLLDTAANQVVKEITSSLN